MMTYRLLVLTLAVLGWTGNARASDSALLDESTLLDTALDTDASTEPTTDTASPADESLDSDEAPSTTGTTDDDAPEEEPAPPDSDTAAAAYTLSLTIEGTIYFAPKIDSLEGGLQEIAVTYTLSLESDIPDITQSASIQAASKIDAAVSGYLFNANNIPCELRIDIPETDTTFTLTPKKGEDEIPEMQFKIRWPDKIEERWESYCLISASRPLITSGDYETAFYSLIGHADPTLSSFVVTSDAGTYKEEFAIEYIDGESDDVYEQSGTGSGTLILTPKS